MLRHKPFPYKIWLGKIWLGKIWLGKIWLGKIWLDTIWLTLIIGLLISLSFRLDAQETSAQAITIENLERIQRATVFIMQANSTDMSVTCIGTGTIVRYDGYILTNAHNAVQSAACPGDTLIIAMAVKLNEPPIPKYRADVVQVDERLDLALLRITREFDGRLIEPASLPAFPFVDLADSSQTQLDETITVVGYPTLGNSPVTAIRGTVSGQITEPSGGWTKFRTVEPISGLMTGGGAYNREGRLIGIPTSAPAFGETSENCNYLQDTNNDSFINDEDTCVPIGDVITVMRPANFARSLIRSASLGLTIEKLTAPSYQVTSTSEPVVRNLFFSPSVSDGLPTTVVGSMPTGTNNLYLFFDYANMTPQTVYELRVNVDGVPNAAYSLPPVRWSGAQTGLWYIGSSGQPWVNGRYEFRLFINGIAAASNTIDIGGPALTYPNFSTIVFGVLDQANNLQGNGFVLPAGSSATARFIYQHMQPGMPWTALLYYNNQQQARIDSTWDTEHGSDGYYPLNFRPDAGFPPGNYRVELYLNGLLSAAGDFVVAGNNVGAVPDVFSDIEFIRTSSPLLQPTGTPARTFPDGANTLYAIFDWQQIAPGTLWTMRWSIDDEVFYEETLPWSSPASGEDFITRLTAPEGLPDATYKLELLINDIPLRSAEVTVGIGQLEIDRFAPPDGVQLRGQIIDADTRRGIEGATFILISEDYSVADFTWQRDQIYALATTDRNGNFEIDRPLQLEAPYSVIIAVEGYLPIARDAFTIEPDEQVPIEMLIPMSKD